MKSCPICHSLNTQIFHHKVWHFFTGKVYQCQDCDITFLNPFLTIADEKEFYEDYNKHVQQRGVILSKKPQEFHKTSMPVAEQRWKLLQKYFLKGDKILEIGCSTGAFLSQCTNYCKCYGVELDPENRKFSKQFSIDQFDRIENVSLDHEFDIICLFHVFEHIRNPFKFLNEIKKRLKKKGFLVLEVPSINDPLISVYRLENFMNFYFQPMHPFIYSLKSLQYVLKKSGFTEDSIIFHQRYGLANHLSWLKNGQPGGDEKLTALFGTNREYCDKLEKNQLTDTIFYIATI